MNSPASSITAESNVLSFRALLFAAFACSMAIMSFVALAGPIARTLFLAPWHIGVTMTIAGVTWITTARWWGKQSDKRGRRPVLLFSLAGFALSYLALCVFIDIALQTSTLVWLAFAGLTLGRGLVGLFYAAIPSTAAALVADHVEPTQRAGVMARLGVANGLGMVLGPGLVGLLSPFGLSAPLYITAILPIMAGLLLWRTLPSVENAIQANGTAPRLNDSRLIQPSMIAFVAAFSVSVAQITVGFFSLDRFNLAPGAAAQVAGIALTVVGVTLVVSQSLLKHINLPLKRLIQIGATVSALGFGAMVFVTTTWHLWLCYAIAAAGMGWVYPSVSAMAANAVEAHEQGVAAGTISAMQGLGTVIGPVVSTLVYSVSMQAPFLLLTVLLIITTWLTTSIQQQS